MCKSSVHNYQKKKKKKEFWTQSIQKEKPATSYKKQPKIRLRFAKKYQDLSEKEWEYFVNSNESPMYLFKNKIETMTLFGEAR